MRPLLHAVAAIVLAACASEPAPQLAPEKLVLTGEITRADHQTYREIPFIVPTGTTRITVDFAYTGKENRTVIDIGLRDPDGQRGWSGGNKSSFTIGQFDATPSYANGIPQQGEWKLILGIPNVREGQTATYTATIAFDTLRERSDHDDFMGRDITSPLSPEPGWRRGDFHAHTAHSDGSCDVAGTRSPCPATRTFEAARNAGLDFVAITDHNTITQVRDIRFQQGAYPKTLLIPGTEITTFNGHANVIGNSDFLDFQLGSPRLPTLANLFDQMEGQGGFISINHPSLPSGEACMGCGWTVKDTDWSRVTAIEVINGASMRTSGPEGAFNGIAFWESRLKEGHRITAIAGSDNHNATDTTGAKQSPVGAPATVVYASELSTSGIIAGVKSGRVFIDVAGLPDATLDTRAELDGKAAMMGGELSMTDADEARVDVTTTNLPAGARPNLTGFGVDVVKFNNETFYRVAFVGGATRGWVRATVRDAAGKLLLLGNPIYLVRTG